MGERGRIKRAATPIILPVCLVALGLLWACTDSPTANNQATTRDAPCLPATGAEDAAPARAERAHVYIDRSQSMSGYVSPELGRSQALADLLRLFERQLPTVAPAVDYRAFGADIDEAALELSALSLFASPAAYNCRACDNQESHIDKVLDEIARAPGTAMHLVVTDLWLDNRSFRGSDEVALGEPLRAILRSGRAVGVIGIRAPFSGPVYNVPGIPGGNVYRDARERPLFVLMVGPPDSLAEVHRRLIESRSPALAPDRLQFSLYSAALSDAAPELGVATRRRGASRVRALRAGNLREQPQFQIALNYAEQGRGSIEGAFSLAPRTDHMVWQGDVAERTRVWQLQREDALDQCPADTWVELESLRGAWRPSGEPGRFIFSVDHRLGERLPAPGTYYLLGELGVSGLTVPNPQTGWMEEWSLSPADAPAFVRDRPELFKALNLGRFRAILDEELQRQLENRTRMTRRTAFLLRLEQ